MLNTVHSTTRELINERLTDGDVLFLTLRDDETGFTSSRAMLYRAPEGDYVVQLLVDGFDRPISTFGDLASALEHGKEVLDAFIAFGAFEGGITTQLSNRIHRLDA
jgi:hypothetical protein